MARYLVTGGAGFIGSHLVEALLVRGDEVRVVDNLSTGKRANLEAATDAARAGGAVGTPEFVDGDLADLAVATAAVAGMDYVLHQAAIPSVPRSVADPVSSNRANIDATLNVLVAARDAGVKRLVFAGSSSVYGDAAEMPKREDMPARPLSPYALQKLVGEQYLALFTSLYGLETVSTRYFNVFGPRQDPSSPYSGVISLFVRARARRHRADDSRRRRPDARLHLRRQHRGRRAARGRGAGRGGRGDQRGHQRPRVAERVVATRCSGCSARRSRRSTGRRAPAMCATRRRPSTRPRACSATSRWCTFDEGLRRTVEWAAGRAAAAVVAPRGYRRRGRQRARAACACRRRRAR